MTGQHQHPHVERNAPSHEPHSGRHQDPQGGRHHDPQGGHHHEHPRRGVLDRVRHALIPHSHDHTEQVLVGEEARAHGIRAAWISLVVMGATALGQVLIVWLSGSMALLADTLHNLGHLATTIPLIIAFRLTGRAPTARYPHGFRRAEDVVGLLIAGVIALSAAVIIVESIRAFTRGPELTHLGWVFAAGLVGFVGNELVAVYRIRAGRRIGSAALVAEGNHARADGLTSLAVVASAVAAWLGLPQLDAVIGLVIGVFILWILLLSLRSIMRRLMDGVEDGLVDTITATAAQADQMVEVALARARWSGHTLQAEVEVTTTEDLTLAQADTLAGRVEQALIGAVPHLAEAWVRVRPAGTQPPRSGGG